MVAHPGAQDGSRRLRPLNRPRPLRVEAGEGGTPVAVHLSNGRFGVEEVLEVWRIDDEWWRKRPLSRTYYRLLLEDGRTVTVYRDEVSGQWAKQGY